MFARLVTRRYTTTPSRTALSRWGKNGVKIIGSFGLLWWFTDRVASIVWIEGGSMRPALNPDPYARGSDLVLIQRWRYIPDQVRAGDVVCFKSPTHSGRQLIKRVIAVNHAAAPQHIRVHSHTLRAEDDKLLQLMHQCNEQDKDEDARDEGDRGEGEQHPPRIDRDQLARWREVPAGHVWVEGDNHRSSIDSNHYGPIPLALIQGRASHVLWPQNRAVTGVMRVIARSVPREASHVKVTPL